MKSELQVDLELVQSKREILIAKPLAFYTIKKLEKINMLQSSDFRSQISDVHTIKYTDNLQFNFDVLACFEPYFFTRKL